jgi:hypothetical protein
MTRLEFSSFLKNYKIFTEDCKEIFKRQYPEETFMILYIKDGRIKVEAESEMNFDITKEVLENLMPDDFIF